MLKTVYYVSAYSEIRAGSIFATKELAKEALKKKLEEIKYNHIQDLNVQEDYFSFMTGGWESQKIVWKIYPIMVCETLSESNMFFDRKAFEAKQRAEEQARTKEKEKFWNNLPPDIQSGIEKHWGKLR